VAKTICIGALLNNAARPRVVHFVLPSPEMVPIRKCQQMLARFDELVVYVGLYHGIKDVRQIYIASGIARTKLSGNDVIETCIGIFPRAEAWRVFRAHVRML
jgi:hypothetical protein